MKLVVVLLLVVVVSGALSKPPAGKREKRAAIDAQPRELEAPLDSDVKRRSLNDDIDIAGSDISSNGEEKENSALDYLPPYQHHPGHSGSRGLVMPLVSNVKRRSLGFDIDTAGSDSSFKGKEENKPGFGGSN